MEKRNFKLLKLRKIRKVFLGDLDKRGWPWNSDLSNLLDQLDSIIFGMRYGT